MVPVAADECAEIPFDKRFQLFVGQTTRRVVPLVETLVPHEQAKLVAHVQRLGRDGIMAGAQRVRPHVLHQQQLAANSRTAVGAPQKPHVFVKVHPLKLYAPSVEMETILLPDVRVCAYANGKRNLAYSKAHTFRCGFAPARKRAFGLVETRRNDIPQLRVGEFNRHLTPRRIWQGGLSTGRRHSTTGLLNVLKEHPHLDLRLGYRISDLPTHVHNRTILLRNWRGDCNAVIGKMRLGHRLEDNLAVYAAARIPAAALAARIGDHDQAIGSRHDERSRVHAKRLIAVVPSAGKLSVDVNFRPRHDAIEVKRHHSGDIARRHDERPTINANVTPRQLAGIAILGFCVERTFNRPVVRNLNCAP